VRLTVQQRRPLILAAYDGTFGIYSLAVLKANHVLGLPHNFEAATFLARKEELALHVVSAAKSELEEELQQRPFAARRAIGFAESATVPIMLARPRPRLLYFTSFGYSKETMWQDQRVLMLRQAALSSPEGLFRVAIVAPSNFADVIPGCPGGLVRCARPEKEHLKCRAGGTSAVAHRDVGQVRQDAAITCARST
jgi:hypothetical protein